MSIGEQVRRGEFILSEAYCELSRDTVNLTLAGDQSLKAGAMVGRVSNTSVIYQSGVFRGADDGATDGSEVIAGILLDAVENATADPVVVQVVIVNKFAEVSGELLDAGGLAIEIVDAQLRNLGIKVRNMNAVQNLD